MAELIMKTNIFDVDFEKGTLRPREAVQLVQYDNKTNLFVFNIVNEMALGNSLMLRIKHYEGNEFEYPLVIKDNRAQILITNNITYVPGEMKLSVSLIGTDNRILTTVEMLENIPIIEAISDNNQLKKEMQELIADHLRKLDAGYFDGAEVQIRKADNHIQWKLTDEEDTEWKNVVCLDELIGPQGVRGISGIYVGETEPTDPEILVWIDTTEDALAVDIKTLIEQLDKILHDINGEDVQ